MEDIGRRVTKSAIIIAMARKGARTRDIAKAANCRPEYVRVVIRRYAARGDVLPSGKPQSVPVWNLIGSRQRQRYRDEAVARGMSSSELIARVLKVTARDNLFNAVLGGR